MQDTLSAPAPMDATIVPEQVAGTEQLQQSLTPERVNELPTIAKPLVDAMAATQEMRNGLANLWKEAHPIDEDAETPEATIGAIARLFARLRI